MEWYYVFGDLDYMRRAGCQHQLSFLFFCIVTHPKSYMETTDRRDFGSKPSEWR